MINYKVIGEKIRRSKEYKNMTQYYACELAEGFGDGEGASMNEILAGWQYLVDTGMCWKLQGFYGRNATYLIEQGAIAPAKNDHVDYYGNLVPGIK